jgi:hypothetical protein
MRPECDPPFIPLRQLRYWDRNTYEEKKRWLPKKKIRYHLFNQEEK